METLYDLQVQAARTKRMDEKGNENVGDTIYCRGQTHEYHVIIARTVAGHARERLCEDDEDPERSSRIPLSDRPTVHHQQPWQAHNCTVVRRGYREYHTSPAKGLPKPIVARSQPQIFTLSMQLEADPPRNLDKTVSAPHLLALTTRCRLPEAVEIPSSRCRFSLFCCLPDRLCQSSQRSGAMHEDGSTLACLLLLPCC